MAPLVMKNLEYERMRTEGAIRRRSVCGDSRWRVGRCQRRDFDGTYFAFVRPKWHMTKRNGSRQPRMK